MDWESEGQERGGAAGAAHTWACDTFPPRQLLCGGSPSSASSSSSSGCVAGKVRPADEVLWRWPWPSKPPPVGLGWAGPDAQVGFSSRLAYARNNCRSAQAESGRLKIPWRNEPAMQQLLLANWLVSTRARKDRGRAGSRKRQVGSLAGQS